MGQEQAQVLTNTLSSPTTSQSLLTNSLLSITNTEAAEGRGESKKKAFGLKKPNALTKLYLSADREESAKIASVKAVWILVVSSRSSVCVYTRTRIAGVIKQNT